jgi:hypothetical protein
MADGANKLMTRITTGLRLAAVSARGAKQPSLSFPFFPDPALITAPTTPSGWLYEPETISGDKGEPSIRVTRRKLAQSFYLGANGATLNINDFTSGRVDKSFSNPNFGGLGNPSGSVTPRILQLAVRLIW